MQETWVRFLVQEDPAYLEPGLWNKRGHPTTTREPWEVFLKVFIDFVTVLLLVLFLSFMFWFFGPKACGILAPWPGIKPLPPALEGRVLTTRLPRKFLEDLSFSSKESSEKASPGLLFLKYLQFKIINLSKRSFWVAYSATLHCGCPCCDFQFPLP